MRLQLRHHFFFSPTLSKKIFTAFFFRLIKLFDPRVFWACRQIVLILPAHRWAPSFPTSHLIHLASTFPHTTLTANQQSAPLDVSVWMREDAMLDIVCPIPSALDAHFPKDLSCFWGSSSQRTHWSISAPWDVSHYLILHALSDRNVIVLQC